MWIDQYRGLAIPPIAKEHMSDMVNVFNGGCNTCGLTGCGFSSIPNCIGISACANCILAWCGGGRQHNRETFAKYARSQGYKITRKEFETMETREQRIKISIPESAKAGYTDLLRAVVYGWLSVHEMKCSDDIGAFQIDTEGTTVNVDVLIEKLQNNGVDVDDLFCYLKKLEGLVNQAMPGIVDFEGVVYWEHGDHTHKIFGDGSTLRHQQLDRVVREMTVDEISRLLGYEVKVVGEKK